MVSSDAPPPRESEFVPYLQKYEQALLDVLIERQQRSWKQWALGLGGWGQYDPELGKVIQRLYSLIGELLRMHCVAPPDVGGDEWRGLSDEAQERVLRLLREEPEQLRLDSGLEMFDALDRLTLEVADDRYLFAELSHELYLNKRPTTWVRWSDVFHDQMPCALGLYYEGCSPKGHEVYAVRRKLASLRRVRSEDYQVHRARQRMRAQNLRILSVLLIPIVFVFGWLIAVVGEIARWQVALVACSGALGALAAGTYRAKDRLARGSDLRAFRAGVIAQLLLGAGSALFLLLFVKTGGVTFGDAELWAGQAVVGFVAGFSEPFVLKTVERVATLGQDGIGT